MKVYVYIIVSVIIIFLIAFLIYAVKANKSVSATFNDTIIIALIGALTAFATVFSSIYLNTQNAKQQRAVEVRKMKQEFYHKLNEAMLLKLTFLNNQGSKEFFEADLNLCKEKNRLPLYASQEVVEFFEQLANENSPNSDFKTFFEMIRKDLINEDLEKFKDLHKLSFTFPAQVTRQVNYNLKH